MDPETQLDAVRNVGIRDGKIVSITEDEVKGAETIDATGHVVAPGFIDTHVHIVDHPFGQKLMLRDGVTTPLDLQLSFRDITQPEKRHFFNRIPTSFSLTDEQVDTLIAAGRELLRANPDYQRFVASLGGSRTAQKQR